MDFPGIKKQVTGPTRKKKVLDVIYTDLPTTKTELLNPIETEDRVPSDHKIIFSAAQFDKRLPAKNYYYYTQPITKKGRERFQRLLLDTDWETIRGNNCSESATKLAQLLDSYVEQCFPKKRKKARTGDMPWINNKAKKYVRRKRRVYKKEGRSELYYAIRDAADKEILLSLIHI